MPSISLESSHTSPTGDEICSANMCGLGGSVGAIMLIGGLAMIALAIVHLNHQPNWQWAALLGGGLVLSAIFGQLLIMGTADCTHKQITLYKDKETTTASSEPSESESCCDAIERFVSTRFIKPPTIPSSMDKL